MEIEGKEEEEKRKGEDVRICPLEDMRVLLEHRVFSKSNHGKAK